VMSPRERGRSVRSMLTSAVDVNDKAVVVGCRCVQIHALRVGVEQKRGPGSKGVDPCAGRSISLDERAESRALGEREGTAKLLA
jgi:hypothetical protein